MTHSLKSVKVRCPECGATHYRLERISADDPPDSLEKRCIAPHPNRGDDFNGCGETLDLEVVEVSEID